MERSTKINQDDKPGFGLDQLVMKTPEWAKWFFRAVFLLTTASSVWIASTNLLSQDVKYEVTLILKVVIDPLAYGFSKMFGVRDDSKTKFEYCTIALDVTKNIQDQLLEKTKDGWELLESLNPTTILFRRKI